MGSFREAGKGPVRLKQGEGAPGTRTTAPQSSAGRRKGPVKAQGPQGPRITQAWPDVPKGLRAPGRGGAICPSLRLSYRSLGKSISPSEQQCPVLKTGRFKMPGHVWQSANEGIICPKCFPAEGPAQLVERNQCEKHVLAKVPLLSQLPTDH